MAIFYSTATGGFYDTDIHASIPQPARQISCEDHARLLSEQADGRQIVADASGFPITVEPGEPSFEERFAAMRARRDAHLRASDQTQLSDYPISAELRAAWAVYRQQLRDLPATIENIDQVEWPTPPEQ